MSSKHIMINALFKKLLRLRLQVGVNDEFVDVLDTINALIMPFGWVRLDPSHDLHYVHVVGNDVSHQHVAACFAASYVWEYSFLSHTFKCRKCRNGQVTPGTVWTHDGVQVID